MMDISTSEKMGLLLQQISMPETYANDHFHEAGC